MTAGLSRASSDITDEVVLVQPLLDDDHGCFGGLVETVDDDIHPVGHVQERVLEQDARLDCRVEIEAVAGVRS
jgi:hypothetical protein